MVDRLPVSSLLVLGDPQISWDAQATFGTSGSAISYGTNGSFQGNYGAGFSGNEDYGIHAGGRFGSTNLTQVYRWTWATDTVAYVGALPASRCAWQSVTRSRSSLSGRFILLFWVEMEDF